MRQLDVFGADKIMTGLGLGLHRIDIPLWEDGREIIFANASVQTQAARETLLTFSDIPLDVAQSFTLARKRAYLATSTGVFRYVGPQTENEVASLLANQPSEGFFEQLLSQSMDRCTLLPWGDWVIMTDGVNQVKINKNSAYGSVATPDLGGVPWTYARVIAKYQSHMFAANTSLNGRRVYWSALDDPETWTAALTNDAGSNPLRDLDSRVEAMVPLGTNLAIYATDQLALCRYVAGIDVMSFAPALNGIGAINPRSIVPNNRFNWGLHRRGIFYTDGVQFDYVDEPSVRAWLKANVNWDLKEKVKGFHDEGAQMIAWVVPVNDGGYVTIGYHYKNQCFTVVNENSFFADNADVFDDCIIGFDRSVAIQGSGTRPNSWVQTKPLDCGDRTTEKLFQMLRMHWEYSGSPTVQLAYLENLNDDPSFEDSFTPADLVDGTDFHISGPGRAANFLAVKISSSGGDWFRISGLELHGEAAGLRK